MYAKLNAKQQAKASAAARRDPVYSLYAMLGGHNQTEIRCYQPGAPIFARATREWPGPYSRWEFHPVDDEEGVFTIKNVGLESFIVANADGALVVARSSRATPTEFRVEPTYGGFVEIKLSNGDEVWGVKGDSSIYGEIVLQAADGSDTQKFGQVRVDS